MKKISQKLLICIATLGVLAGCASEEENIIMAPLPVVQSEFTPKISWTNSVGNGVEHYFSQLSPEFAYQTLYVASRDGKVKALDPTTGKTQWETSLANNGQARVSGGILAAYGRIYLGTENGEVFALDAQTGKTQWVAQVEGEVLAAPIAESNLIIINNSRGTLLALNEANGDLVWQIHNDAPSLTLRGDSRPVALSGGVFWGTSAGRLAAAVVEQGQMIWQQAIGQPKGSTEIDRLVDVDASPIIIGSTLYIIGYNGQLAAIDLRSGEIIWRRNYSSAQNMGTDGARLFVVTDKDHIVAVDARSGTELWSNKQLQHRLVTAPVLIEQWLVVADSQGYVHWLDRSSGEFVAQQWVHGSGFAVSPVNLPDGYVTITRNGQLKKFKLNP